MKFNAIYADGSIIEISISGNPLPKDVIQTQVFEHEFEYFLSNIDRHIDRILSFKYAEDDSCKYVEYISKSNVKLRFNFHCPAIAG